MQKKTFDIIQLILIFMGTILFDATKYKLTAVMIIIVSILLEGYFDDEEE